MSLFSSAFGKIRESYDRRKEEAEKLEEMRKESEREAQLVFEKEYRDQVRELAIKKAKEDAMNKSGMAKFRALERARVLEQKKGPQKGFLQRLSDYTRGNIVKTAERRKAYAERMSMIKKLQAETKQKNLQLRQQRMQRNVILKERKSLKPFSPSFRKPYVSQFRRREIIQ